MYNIKADHMQSINVPNAFLLLFYQMLLSIKESYFFASQNPELLIILYSPLLR